MVMKSLDKYSKARLARLYTITTMPGYKELARFLTSEAFLEIDKVLPSSRTRDISDDITFASGIKHAATVLRGLQKRLLPKLKGVELS